MNISRVLVAVSAFCCLVQAADVPKKTVDGKEATIVATAITAITSPKRPIPSRVGSPVRHQYSSSWPQTQGGGCLAHYFNQSVATPKDELKPLDTSRMFDCCP